MAGQPDLGSRLRRLAKQGEYDEIVSLAAEDRNVILELTKLLEDPDENMRWDAATALGWIATEDAEAVKPAVPRLIKALEDSDKHVQGSAAAALGRVGEEDPEVVKPVLPELIKLMENPEAWVRGNAARTLGRIGRKEPETVKAAIPRLIALLEDSYDYVRVCAVEALGWIGDAAALEPLRLLAQDSARARVSRGGKWIETTLGEIAREAIQSIEAGRKSPGS